MKRALLLVALTFLQPQAHAERIELRAVFDQGPLDEFRHVSIPLSEGFWRVGDESGPLAPNALIRRVLADLREVKIGGFGYFRPSPGTFPTVVAFSIDDPVLGDLKLDEYGSWSGTNNLDAFGEELLIRQRSVLGSWIVLSQATTPYALIGFRFQKCREILTLPCLGGPFDHSAQFGKNLDFLWMPHDGLGTAFYLFEDGGRASLFGEVDTAAPEPATLLSAGVALALVALRLRR